MKRLAVLFLLLLSACVPSTVAAQTATASESIPCTEWVEMHATFSGIDDVCVMGVVDHIEDGTQAVLFFSAEPNTLYVVLNGPVNELGVSVGKCIRVVGKVAPDIHRTPYIRYRGIGPCD